jgi:ribonuclease HII
MTIVAGIDEAGYGPLLGPLVVAASAYRLAPGAKEAALDRLVRDKAQLKRGLPTADSKQLFHGGGSIERIELSTLGHVVLAQGLLPVTIGGLLSLAIDLPDDELAELPWYAGRLAPQSLPRRAAFEAVIERADQHRQWLTKRGATFEGLILAPVLVPRFNRITGAAGTKAFTLFITTCRLIETLVQRYPDEELIIHIDRQGGRIHYGDMLQTCFPLAPLTTVSERPAESVYQLDWPRRAPVRIDFRVKADAARAPVAMASVAAKTLRELCMECFCSWFTERRPELAPSAGYGTDGRRFLNEVTDLLRAESIPLSMVERCR